MVLARRVGLRAVEAERQQIGGRQAEAGDRHRADRAARRVRRGGSAFGLAVIRLLLLRLLTAGVPAAAVNCGSPAGLAACG